MKISRIDFLRNIKERYGSEKVAEAECFFNTPKGAATLRGDEVVRGSVVYEAIFAPDPVPADADGPFNSP